MYNIHILYDLYLLSKADIRPNQNMKNFFDEKFKT